MAWFTRFPVNAAKSTGRPIQDKIKEHERDIRLARTQTSAVSEHANNTGHSPLWNEGKFIDRDPHWYTRRVEEAFHNINRDSGIEIPEAWMSTLKKHNNNRTVQQGTAEGTTHRNSEYPVLILVLPPSDKQTRRSSVGVNCVSSYCRA